MIQLDRNSEEVLYSERNCPTLGKHEKCLEQNSVTQTPCCSKDESHPLFHQSVTQLTTVKLSFDQILTMICVSSRFRCSLLFLAFFMASQTLAKPGNSANSTPVSSTAAKHCNNMYNSFYAGPNKKIETILQEMKKQLTQVQEEDILKELHLESLIPHFLAERNEPANVAALSDEELCHVGVTTIGDRLRLRDLCAVAEKDRT